MKPSKPTVSDEVLQNFLAKELKIKPQKSHGMSQIHHTVYNHVSNLHKYLSNWMEVCDKGTSICQTIQSLKMEECSGDRPQCLQPIVEKLLQCKNSLNNIVKDVAVLNDNLKVLAQLPKESQDLNEGIDSIWSSEETSKAVNEIFLALEKEYELKQTVVENIARSNDTALTEVYASSWEFNVYFHPGSTSFLFENVGLPKLINNTTNKS